MNPSIADEQQCEDTVTRKYKPVQNAALLPKINNIKSGLASVFRFTRGDETNLPIKSKPTTLCEKGGLERHPLEKGISQMPLLTEA